MIQFHRYKTRVKRWVLAFLIVSSSVFIIETLLRAYETTDWSSDTKDVELTDSQKAQLWKIHQENITQETDPLQAEGLTRSILGNRLYAKASNSVKKKLDYKNLRSFASDARVFRSVIETLQNISKIDTSLSFDRTSFPLINKLELKLFPWIQSGRKHQSWWAIQESYASGRGIVITCGNWHFKYALLLVRSLRGVLNSTLPIEVFFDGNEDLSAESQLLLSQIENVKAINFQEILDTKKHGIAGWSLKTFAMLFSSFEEIVFIDADVLFFQDPEVLFHTDAYQETGVVLFRDRTIAKGMKQKGYYYAQKAIESLSEYAKSEGRMLSARSIHDGESGVLVWNKRRAFVELLVICAINSDPFVKDLHDAFHGDKESYWIVMEMMQSPYRWAPTGGGALGYLSNGNKVCGGLYHPDFQLKPLWMNGGIVKNKYTNEGSETMEITHWVMDVGFDDQWEWETSKTPFCHKQSSKVEIGKLTESELEIVRQTYHVWENI